MTRLCDRCMACARSGEEILYAIAHMDEKSMERLLTESPYMMTNLHEKAKGHARERMESQRADLEEGRRMMRAFSENFSHDLLEKLLSGGDEKTMAEEYVNDGERVKLEEELTRMESTLDGVEMADIRRSLKGLVEDEAIEIEDNRIRITPRGARQLARHVVEKLMENVAPVNSGTTAVADEGFGVSRGYALRAFEHGDEFDRIDTESTLLKALSRKGNGNGRIAFSVEDLMVRETLHDSRLCIGLIIDESGSMKGEKMRAARDISLALSEVIRQNFRDTFRLFLFSEETREIPYWDIHNTPLAGGATDIRGAMRKFRNATSGQRADRQLYLVTDSEPNCQHGRFVGFDLAASGLMKEAALFRREGITLNIVMLDPSPRLREFASRFVRRNLGRVFFTDPGNLGRVVIEDYLRVRKKGLGNH